MPIRVFIAHESPSVRGELHRVLRREGELAVVGEAADGTEALAQCRALVPDVLVLDVILPTLNGVSVLEKIRAARLPTRALVVSEQRAPQWIRWAIEAGASGYLFADEDLAQVPESIRAVQAGEVRLSAPGLQLLLEESASSAAGPHRSLELTNRERQVLVLLISGKRSAEIAAILGISSRTVDAHRSNLMRKLGAHSPAELVRLALQDRLV